MSAPVDFVLNGEPAQAQAGESLLQTAQRLGLELPHLCQHDRLRPDGNCRACVVEIVGERALAASCCRSATPGMEVHSTSARALKSRQMVLELLLADLPAAAQTGRDAPPEGQHEAVAEPDELGHWAQRLGVSVRPALQALRRPPPPVDRSHPAITVNLAACIQCGRCQRACREVQVNGVIGLAFRGAQTQVVFDLHDALGHSHCVACGECVQVCPTGALLPGTPVALPAAAPQSERRVDSVCPFCGVGCRLTYHVKPANPASGSPARIVRVEGADGPANQSRLCVKGRFGFDYVSHPERLTQPLIRLAGAPKDAAHLQRQLDWRGVFRQASWEEALALAAGGFKQVRDQHGAQALAGFGSAKGSNEEAYLFQKLVRTVFGSNNVDHCTRLCHASSVAALLEGIGTGAVSNPVRDVEHAELILVIGANPSANHPVAASWIKNAARRGARIVLADPRATDLSQQAWRTLQFRPGTDVALLNALLHVIVTENLTDATFISERTEGFAALKSHLTAYTPEAMAPICGIDADTIRLVARAYASARASMILWGMGVSQHVHGTDNVRCLIALAAITGQIGRPGTGLHPLRGQNNVQGASDAGLIPMMLPNYQRVTDPVARAWFEQFWGCALDPQPGLTVVEILNQALAAATDPKRLRGLYVMGENPAMSDPDLNHTRRALAALEHLVVQDIFLTETAFLADVVLPASAWPEKTGSVSNTDRVMQLGRQALPPPGQARADLWIIKQLAQRIGPYAALPSAGAVAPGQRWDYPGADHGVAAIHEEMRLAMQAAMGGITWQRLQRESSVTYPCHSESDAGEAILFRQRFPTASGRARLLPVRLSAAAELPDADYPLVLITGRQLEHWHTGSMTRRTRVLDALEPSASVWLCAAELQRHRLSPGDRVLVASRRGQIELSVRQDDGTPAGALFIPFAYVEAAANLLTHAALDPVGKIPEFKFCAVRLCALPTASSSAGVSR